MTDPAPPETPIVWRRPRDGGRAGGVVSWVALAAVLGLVGITLAGREMSAPVAPLAVAVTLLPYLFAAVAASLFAAWCVVPDRRALPALLVLVLVGAGLLWGPSWPVPADGVDGTPLRVMTWNVRRLWGGPGDGGDPRGCVVDTIRAEDPDLLALLEVSARDVADLSEALDLDCAHVDYLGTGSESHGGLAACARRGWRLVSGDPQVYVDGDEWRYVFTEMERDGRVVNLLAVHLHPYYPALSHQIVRTGVRDLARGEPETLIEAGEDGAEVIRVQGAQSVALLSRVDRFHDPTLVVGDFNGTRDSALHVGLRSVLTDAWERGGDGFGSTARLGEWLPLRIDYVYATDAFVVRSAHVPAADCSDHRPVVSDLVLRAAP